MYARDFLTFCCRQLTHTKLACPFQECPKKVGGSFGAEGPAARRQIKHGGPTFGGWHRGWDDDKYEPDYSFF